jgi:pimeloyl-ACP methyl ester carboxylesterase
LLLVAVAMVGLPVRAAAAERKPPPTSTPATSTSTTSTPAAPLQWHSCNNGAQCAKLAVPLDDTVTGGPTIDLALVRYRARDQQHRIGSLVVNPGGPGASGVDFANALSGSLPTELRNRFDLVGFDPRGTGESEGVDCHVDLDAYYALDWAPSNLAERLELIAGVKQVVDACQRVEGPLLPYLTTERTARDLDRIRAALGDDKLTYYGGSYGTYLGAWYAEQFPERVRALVLDGAVDPALNATKVQVQQAASFEHDLNLFFENCASDAGCAFHRDGHPAEAYDALRARIDQSPLAAKSYRGGRTLNATQFDLGVTELLYQGHDAWGSLSSALDSAASGDGSDLLADADDYTGRQSDGSYDAISQAFLAIGCADGPPVGGIDGIGVIEAKAAKVAPRLGPAIVNNSLACALWPVVAHPAKALHAVGAPPIVVFGTRNDPATPVAWAHGLARELASGVLVTVGGERHGAFLLGNSCIDNIGVRYLVDLTPPADGTRC